MVIVFDVNGTLLDTEALGSAVRRIFGSKYTVREWFTEVVQYAMATTLSGDYREFGDIAVSVLKMAASARNVSVSTHDVANMRKHMRELPAFPEIKKSLHRLKGQGFRLAALSNSSTAALENQLRHAGLTEFFERIVSVDSVQRFKPAAEPYHAAARSLGVRPSEMIMVAAHPWDLMGASLAGCRTAFISRPGKALYPGTSRPDYIANDVGDLADRLLGNRRSWIGPVLLAGVAVTGAYFGAIALRGFRSRPEESVHALPTDSASLGTRRSHSALPA